MIRLIKTIGLILLFLIFLEFLVMGIGMLMLCVLFGNIAGFIIMGVFDILLLWAVYISLKEDN